MHRGCGKRPNPFLCFLAALGIAAQNGPPAWADTLRPVQEGSQRSGLEEQLRSSSLRENIRVHLNPVLRDQNLEHLGEFLIETRKLTQDVWSQAVLRGATTVAFEGIPARSKGKEVQFILSKTQYVGESSTGSNVSRLILVADVQSRMVLSAYDQQSRELIYSAPRSFLEVYVDPQLENGRLPQGAKPIRKVKRATESLWHELKERETRVVAFAEYPTIFREETIAFYFRSKVYLTTQRYREGQERRLLLLVDVQTRIPLEAYDFLTGERLFSSEDFFDVYLSPELKDGKLVNPGDPFIRSLGISSDFWKRKEVAGAKTVAISNVRVVDEGGMEGFAVAARRYRTQSTYADTSQARRLLVLVDPQSKKVLAAFDLRTGEEVYQKPETDRRMIDIHLDPEIRDGKLVGNPKPLRTMSSISGKLWNSGEVAQAQTIVLANMPTEVNERRKRFFSLAHRYYTLDVPYEPSDSVQLLVVLRRGDPVPVEAYDMETGTRVFSSEDWLRVYLDPPMESGRLVGKPNPLMTAKTFLPSLWRNKDVTNAGTVVVTNVKLFDSNDWAGFSLAGVQYRTGIPYDDQGETQATVVLDSRTQAPVKAYASSSGQQIYPPEESIQVYLNPPLKEGRLDANAILFRSVGRLSPQFFGEPKVQSATTVVLKGIPTWSSNGWMVFSFLGDRYVTSRPAVPDRSLELLVVVDPKKRIPTAAYDIQDGEQVYPSEGEMRIYLDATVVDGRISGDPKPFSISAQIPRSLWSSDEVLKSRQIIFSNMRTWNVDRFLGFTIDGVSYGTTIPFSETISQTRLLVVINSSTRKPVSAYEMAGGQKVYPGEDWMCVYLDPHIEQGQVLAGENPYTYIRVTESTLWNDPAVKNARSIAIENVPVRSSGGAPGSGSGAFSIAGRSYRTDSPYDPAHPMSLLVLVDPGSKQPTQAYNLETGEAVYSTEDRIEIHLDPQIEKGQLVGSPKPYQVWKAIPAKLWRDVRKLKAREVVLVNLRAFKMLDQFVFSVSSRTYRTTRSYDEARELRLLVRMDPVSVTPIAAYDLSSGEEVYSSSDRIAVYLNPVLQDGKLSESAILYTTVYRPGPSFWKQAEVEQARQIVLTNVPVANIEGTAKFSVGQQYYSTDRSYESEADTRLLVLVDPKTREVTAAHNQLTGEQLFDATSLVSIYLNPVVQGGQLVGNPSVFQKIKVASSRFWKQKEVRDARTAAFQNLRSHKAHGVHGFSVGGKTFMTGRRYVSEERLRLLVVVDTQSRLPTVAYELSTGDQVYPIPMVPVKGPLKSLADMAAEGDQAWVADDQPQQGGLEEGIAVYLNPDIEKGQLKGNPTPFRSVKLVNAAVWKQPKVRGASQVVLRGVTTHDRGNGVAAFSIANGHYNTNRSFDAGHPLRLLVLMEGSTRFPATAFDLDTSEEVFSSENLIHLYINPRIEGGHLIGKPEPFRVVQNVFSHTLKHSRLQEAQSIGLAHVRTINQKGTAAFHVGRQSYLSFVPYKENDPARFLVLVDPKTQLPLAAFDEETGQQVYAPGDLIRIYLNSEIQGGRLVGRSEPFRTARFVQSSFWQLPEVGKASSVVLENVPTHRRKNQTAFNLAGRHYITARSFSAERPLRLLVVADPSSREPTVAYDMETGQPVYPSDQADERLGTLREMAVAGDRAWVADEPEQGGLEENEIAVYLDPPMESGRLKGEVTPYRMVRQVHPPLWKAPEVQESAAVVLGNVPVSNYRGLANFFLRRKRYSTTRFFDPVNPLHLLVQVDPKTQEPLAAFDQATGEQIYPSADGIQVYLDPVMEGGRLKGKAIPYRTIRRVHSPLQKDPQVQNSSVVVLGNVPTFNRNGTVVFSLMSRRYSTTRSFDARDLLRLLVQVDPRTGTPLTAFDQSTGERIYSAADAILVYLDPPMEGGRLKGEAIPHWTIRRVHSSLQRNPQVQNSSVVVLGNVRTFNNDGRAVFSLGNRRYPTIRSFDPKDRLHLLVQVDPKISTPLAAFDQATGEQVYTSKPVSERLKPLADLARSDAGWVVEERTGDEQAGLEEKIEIYLDPKIKNGKLAGSPAPIKVSIKIHPTFWRRADVQSATFVALKNVPTSIDGGKVVFSLHKTRFFTTRRFDGTNPLRLLVLVNPKTQRPIVAYDVKDGAQVYATEKDRNIFLDPEIKNGRLVGDPASYNTVRSVRSSLWEEPAVKSAKAIAITNVQTYRRKRDGKALFAVAGVNYVTTRPYSSERPLRLLVVVDPRVRIVLAAYDLETGEGVFNSEDFIRIYLDPKIQGGQVVEPSVPYRLFGRLKGTFWNDAKIQHSTTVALFGINTYPQGPLEISTFSFLRGHYSIRRTYQAGQKLLVVVNSKTHEVLVAYDTKTGDPVYSAEQANAQLKPLADMAAGGADGWVTDEPSQGGLEEIAAEVVKGWTGGREGQGLLVVSPEVLSGSAGSMIRQTVSHLPSDVSDRIMLPIQGASAEDVAMTILEQDPLPDRVWVVGSFGPAFTQMLRGMTDVTELAPGSGLEEFLAQVGLMLGVPVEEINAGLEEIRAARPLERAA